MSEIYPEVTRLRFGSWQQAGLLMDTWLGDTLACLSPWPRHVRPRAPRCPRRLESGEASAALTLVSRTPRTALSLPSSRSGPVLACFLPPSLTRHLVVGFEGFVTRYSSVLGKGRWDRAPFALAFREPSMLTILWLCGGLEST